ncbi:MAG: fasciclin domain-containing protein [Gemmatimonadaceae bacterium]|nr:fasciclin domain-containing protein [Gemmatimonadaceae bacterium]
MVGAESLLARCSHLRSVCYRLFTNGEFTVNKANVTSTDIVATNGVIHVIDQVLIPM